jgi:hypothetical protein
MQREWRSAQEHALAMLVENVAPNVRRALGLTRGSGPPSSALGVSPEVEAKQTGAVAALLYGMLTTEDVLGFAGVESAQVVNELYRRCVADVEQPDRGRFVANAMDYALAARGVEPEVFNERLACLQP